jgi:hypothetical protein
VGGGAHLEEVAMNTPRFTRPEPYAPEPADLLGFSAGVLRIEWTQPAESFEITGRPGRVYVALVVECRTSSGRLKIEDARATLHGTIVRAPDGTLSKITGVQTFLTGHVSVGGPEGDLGLLLVPVEET